MCFKPYVTGIFFFLISDITHAREVIVVYRLIVATLIYKGICLVIPSKNKIEIFPIDNKFVLPGHVELPYIQSK